MVRPVNQVSSRAASIGLRPAELIRDLQDGRVVGIRLEIPIPSSKKNNKVVRRVGDQVRVGWASKIKRQERLIAELAAVGIPLRAAGPLFGDLDDVQLDLVHDVEREIVVVEVRRLGPPKSVDGRTGRKRDVPNLFEVVADALNGVVYGDDRQVSVCSARRHLGSQEPSNAK